MGNKIFNIMILCFVVSQIVLFLVCGYESKDFPDFYFWWLMVFILERTQVNVKVKEVAESLI